MDRDYCVVIGGVNVDIGGQPDAPLIPKDSNPGKITISLGGVGRNIAHNLRLLGINVKLVTAFGDDEHGKLIFESCKELGIDVEGYCECPNDATSSYMFINDKSGDMSIAISDMNIYKNITPEYLATRMSMINKAKLAIVDTNIPTESLAYLAKNCKVPILADPVSCTKAARLLPSLSRIYALTPNSIESRILTGIKIDSEEALEQSAKVFLEAGVKNVVLTLGADGIFVANDKQSSHIRNFPVKLVNTTGAGDALLAGLAYGFFNDFSLKDAAVYGLAAAAIACESADTINNNLSVERIKRKAGIEI